LHPLADNPYSPISCLVTTRYTIRLLRWVAAVCSFSLLEKGKKRATSRTRATCEVPWLVLSREIPGISPVVTCRVHFAANLG
jgi:hypothetical protein